jgi:hypothetical protein
MKKISAFFFFVFFLLKLSTPLQATLLNSLDEAEAKLTGTHISKGIKELNSTPDFNFDDFMAIASPKVGSFPNDWTTGAFYFPLFGSIWSGASTMASQSRNSPTQGWKLHVSAPRSHIPEIVKCIVPLLFANNIEHKIANSLKSYDRLLLNSETQKGKFITIYPKNDAHAVEIAQLLDKAVLKLNLSPALFPTPPYEAVIGHSKAISTRYGKFKESSNMSKGNNLYVIDPKTNKLVKDQVTLDKRNGEGWPGIYYPPPPHCTSNPFLDAKMKITKPGEKFVEEKPANPIKPKLRELEVSKWTWQSAFSILYDKNGSPYLNTDSIGTYQLMQTFLLDGATTIEVPYYFRVDSGQISLGILNEDKSLFLASRPFPVGKHEGSLKVSTLGQKQVTLVISNDRKGKSSAAQLKLLRILFEEGSVPEGFHLYGTPSVPKWSQWKSQDSSLKTETDGTQKLITDKTGAYQLMEHIPLCNTETVRLPYKITVNKGAISIGLLSQDQGVWLGNLPLSVGTHEGSFDISTKGQSQVFLVLQNNLAGRDISEITISKLRVLLKDEKKVE